MAKTPTPRDAAASRKGTVSPLSGWVGWRSAWSRYILKGSCTNLMPWLDPPAFAAMRTTSSRERCCGSPGGTRKQSQVASP